MGDKHMELVGNSNNGVDLIIERDSGNDIRILMGGRKENSKKNWIRLRELCNTAIAAMSGR